MNQSGCFYHGAAAGLGSEDHRLLWNRDTSSATFSSVFTASPHRHEGAVDAVLTGTASSPGLPWVSRGRDDYVPRKTCCTWAQIVAVQCADVAPKKRARLGNRIASSRLNCSTGGSTMHLQYMLQYKVQDT